jgi:hypothetical protein
MTPRFVVWCSAPKNSNGNASRHLNTEGHSGFVARFGVVRALNPLNHSRKGCILYFNSHASEDGMPVTASVLYDLVQCRQRVALDALVTPRSGMR